MGEMNKYEILLEAVKEAYLHHHCGYDFVNHVELSQKLLNALYACIGGEGVRKMLSDAIIKRQEERK